MAALQVAHGALFGMSQSYANKRIHVLLPALHQTVIDLEDLPAHHLEVLRQRLAELAATVSQVPTPTPAGSPFFMMAPNDPFAVPRPI